MRHGLRSKNNNEKEEGDSVINSKGALPSSQLGCYFCNDVVAPGDVRDTLC